MHPYYQKDNITLYHGDLRDVLPEAIQPNTVDFVITDPPYGLSFMERDWDFEVPGPTYWETIANVCKPGALLLAFGGTRTYHRLTCAIEDAGWEIRDCLMWLYSQGFPKSLDISKAIDKAAGVEREVIGASRSIDCIERGYTKVYSTRAENSGFGTSHTFGLGIPITAPATPEAVKWSGWGTALKPAWEPIVLAMKPLDGTFAQNAQRHGVAGMNIDGCRIPCDYAAEYGEKWLSSGKGKAGPWHATEYEETRSVAERVSRLGRWPANLLLEHHPECRQIDTTVLRGDPRGNCAGHRPGGFGNVGADSGDGEPNARVYGNEVVPVYQCHPDCPVRALDTQSGTLTSGKMKAGQQRNRSKGEGGYHGDFPDTATANGTYGDSGGASRFFYCSKASKKERGPGNDHPTVKPLDLMKYLLTLASTPTGGVILDPFAGSGTTLMAAEQLGRPCIGVELDAHHCEIATARLNSLNRCPENEKHFALGA